MGNGTEAIIIAHTSCLVPPRKGKRLMIFLVQAIKKLFVTCQAAYDVRGLGKVPEINSIHTHKVSCTIVSHAKAETVHEKQVKLEDNGIKNLRGLGKMRLEGRKRYFG